MVSSYLSKILIMTLMVAMLSACGNSPSNRALSGGAIGAGVGVVGATLLHSDPIMGAVLGGAVGAVAGATTTKKQINLGQ